jgi:hypothetical protein
MQSTRSIFALLGLLVIGCASVISGRRAEVAIRSQPSQAHVEIRNEEGDVVAQGVTPTEVSLKRSKGLLKKPPKYTATLQKPGYEPQHVAIRPKMNPWILGNLVIGGPIGLAADTATGAIWKMSPNQIDQPLTPLSDPYYGQADSDQVAPASFASGTPSE